MAHLGASCIRTTSSMATSASWVPSSRAAAILHQSFGEEEVMESTICILEVGEITRPSDGP